RAGPRAGEWSGAGGGGGADPGHGCRAGRGPRRRGRRRHPARDRGLGPGDAPPGRAPDGLDAPGDVAEPSGHGSADPLSMAKYKVTFLPLNLTVEVDDKDFPYGDHGKPGSLLDIALHNNIRLEHNCGGNCACTTCHVIVKEGEENLSPIESDEEDR